MITSRHNATVKAAASLRSRKHREAAGLTLVDGPRETQRAVLAGVAVERLFVCPEHRSSAETDAETDAAIEAAVQAGAERVDVSPEVFDRLAYGDRTDGVIAVARPRRATLGDLRLPDRPTIAVVEGVEKPGNLGAILRTADGAGVDAVVVADPVIDLFNPNVIRASVGVVFKPNVAVAPAAETLGWLRGLGAPIYAARPDAAINCFDADFSDGAAIVLGNEARGLTDLWNATGVTAVSLPMHGLGDSLNVSTAAAVMFYEALR
ncbi:MAG: RNA methyltransferase, partial [Planctomycetota bacterium]